MRLSKRIWNYFLGDRYGLRVYRLWVDSEGTYIDLSDGVQNPKPGQDDEFVEIQDDMLLPCLSNDSPSFSKKVHHWIFNEKGIEWLRPQIKCNEEWRMEQALKYCHSWLKRKDKKLAKLASLVGREMDRSGERKPSERTPRKNPRKTPK